MTVHGMFECFCTSRNVMLVAKLDVIVAFRCQKHQNIKFLTVEYGIMHISRQFCFSPFSRAKTI